MYIYVYMIYIYIPALPTDSNEPTADEPDWWQPLITCSFILPSTSTVTETEAYAALSLVTAIGHILYGNPEKLASGIEEAVSCMQAAL